MYERTRSPSSGYHAGGSHPHATAKMSNDIGPRKTMFVLVVVTGCFAILWPKVFYPMLVGSANQHIKPSPIDKTTGCCDVFSEIDINTIKIMSELCKSIIHQTDDKPLSGKEIVIRCKAEIQQTCGIDISAVLQEQIRLGRSIKQILSEFCVSRILDVRQERPPHMRPDIIHPAFRERGSAIPRPSGSSKRAPKIVEGRPGPIPGMRPTLGGAGHVVPPSQKTGSSMSVIMPIYTIGIVIFFTYTLMKLIFKKQPDGVGGSLYPPVDPDPRFRREVFESERCKYTPRLSRDPTGKIVVNAMSALLDEVNGEIEARRRANLFVNQAKTSSSDHSLTNGKFANGSVHDKQPKQELPSVKILGMETTASCEGGEKWNKPLEILIPPPQPAEPKSPPQEIYLQGALPAQSQLLVSDSAVVTEPSPNDPAVVLAGKMTLSVISLDDRGSNELSIPSITLESPEMTDLNGDSENLDEDPIEESRYTTASSATAAENEISDDEGTNNEVVEEEVDIETINDLELEEYAIDQLSNGILDIGEELVKEEAEEVERKVEEIQEVEEKGEVADVNQETAKEIEEADVTDFEDKFEKIEKSEIKEKQETNENENVIDEQEKINKSDETEQQINVEKAQENDAIENVAPSEVIKEKQGQKEEIIEDFSDQRRTIEQEELLQTENIPEHITERKEHTSQSNEAINANEKLKEIEKIEEQETMKVVTHLLSNETQGTEKNEKVEEIQSLPEVEIHERIEENPRIDSIQEKSLQTTVETEIGQTQEGDSISKQQCEVKTIPIVGQTMQTQDDKSIADLEIKAHEERKSNAAAKEGRLKEDECVTKEANMAEAKEEGESKEIKNESEPQEIEAELEEEYEEEIEEYEVEVDDDEEIEEIEVEVDEEEDEEDDEKEMIKFHKNKK